MCRITPPDKLLSNPIVKTLRVLIVKPSKYGISGHVERFRRGFMPNGTIPHLQSMTPKQLMGCTIETQIIDEYVQTDLGYLQQLRKAETPTLLALAGVQSHQFQRSLDLAAFALENGVEHCVIGGPHPMTCDTSMLQQRGVSFALAEAEAIWLAILRDALDGELRHIYGENRRWQRTLEGRALLPPSSNYLRRYIVPMLAVYPSRGCPYTCNFCSVIKIAGRVIRSDSIETTLASLRAAKTAGVRLIMFTSDNFNKYPDAPSLLDAMIDENIRLPFFVQCDTQVFRQEGLIEQMARAGCFQMFVGLESFNRSTLRAAHKTQNHPERYGEIVRLCRKFGISTHFSNIIGFPEDTVAGIEEHLDTLIGLEPDLASFYILTPIPGTQQYDEFLDAGRIYETNLDRFDGTCPTAHHDNLSPEQLRQLLFHCYRRFYSASHFLKRGLNDWRIKTGGPERVAFLQNMAVRVYSCYAGFRKMHPMSGGVGRVRRDSNEDYNTLRRKFFGCDSVPLPHSLPLSAEDTVVNNRVRIS